MGFGPDRMRFVGHAIGLELNEAPALARGVQTPLVDGAVIAVEPKLLYPGLGAVGIENSYVVRAGGPEQLTLAGDDAIRVEP
jgi:Xaa-Pro dipeptidase